MLAAPTVAELAEGLRAEVLTGADHLGELVEHTLVGAMSAEAALDSLPAPGQQSRRDRRRPG